MKTFIFKCSAIMLIACSGILFSCKHEDPKPDTLQVAVDNIINLYITLGADVGIIVGIIHNGQKTVYSYGEKELGSREKITAQSVLELASLTKVYTSLALSDMRLKGDLNLDDPIEKYLPEHVNVPSYNGKKITLRHLANHTSGLPTYPGNMDMDAYNCYKGYTEENMYDFINSYTLKYEPGSHYEYSNTGYGLLGEILSLINKSDYETMLINHVIQPLGMAHTTVSFTPDQVSSLVYGHNGNKQVESWSKYQQNIIQGGGSLISTMDDQLIFLEAQLGLKTTSLTSAMLLTQENSFEHTSKYSDYVGLAWSHFSPDGQDILWKNGGNGGYSTFMGFDRTAKTGVVILVNSSLNPEAFSTFSGFEILKVLKQF